MLKPKWVEGTAVANQAAPGHSVEWTGLVGRRGGDLDPVPPPAFVRFLAPTPNPCPSNGSLCPLILVARSVYSWVEKFDLES